MERLQNKVYGLDEKGKIKIFDTKVLKYIESLGFLRYDLNSKKTILVKVEKGCVVSEVNPSIITQSLRELLEQDETADGKKAFEQFLKKDYSSNVLIKTLRPIDLQIKRSTPYYGIFYYRNGVVKVYKNEIKITAYEDFTEGFIWEDQIIKRDFVWNENDEISDSVFKQFCFNISGRDIERFNSLRSITGYLLSDHKDTAMAKAVVLLDEDTDIDREESNGGKGKTLYVEALKQIQPTYVKDGKKLENKNRFMFSGIEPYHRILFFDDVSKEFDFEQLFSVITGEFPAEKKYQDTVNLPFSESPKIVISSNYILIDKGGNSSKRRKIEFEFSSHYGSYNTPDEEFGHMFFRDWNTEEWLAFDHFMMSCVQYFLQNSLVNPSPININENRLRQSVPRCLIEFLDEKVENNIRYDKAELLAEYKERNGYDDRVTSHKFTKKLKVWSECRGASFEDLKSNGKQYIRIRWLD